MGPRDLENPHTETYETETHFRNALRWAEIVQEALTTTIPAHPELFDSAAHRQAFYTTMRVHLNFLIDLTGALSRMRKVWADFSRQEEEMREAENRYEVFKHPVTGVEIPPWTTWLRPKAFVLESAIAASDEGAPKILEMAERGFVPVKLQIVPLPGVLIIESIRSELENIADQIQKQTTNAEAMLQPILEDGDEFTDAEDSSPDGQIVVVNAKGSLPPAFWKVSVVKLDIYLLHTNADFTMEIVLCLWRPRRDGEESPFTGVYGR